MSVVNTPKRQHTIKFYTNEQAQRLTVKLVNSEEHIIDQFSMEWTRLSPINRERCGLLGWTNTVRDAGAASMGTEPKDRFARMRKRAEFLDQGGVDWATREAGSGSLLFQAMMRDNPKLDSEKLKEKLETFTKSQKDALLTSARLRPIVEAIRAEQGKQLDTEQLFAELEQLAS